MLLIYLDQSDWAYLHAGHFPDADRHLRRIGETGRAIFVVTIHHLEETCGLEAPDGRLEVLRNFPGAQLLASPGGPDVVRRDAAMLTNQPHDPHPQFKFKSMAEFSTEALLGYLDELRPGREMRKLLEPLYASNREAHQLDMAVWKNARKPSRSESIKLWQAHARGEIDDALDIIERVLGGRASDTGRSLLERKVASCKKAWDLGHAAGILPSSAIDIDPVFALGVFRHLPEPVKRDERLLAKSVEAWRQAVKTPRPLTCCALVETDVLTNMARHYSAAEQVDALHAAFAPLVGVFTADKRAETILSQRLGLPNVIRTRQLNLVAEIGARATDLSKRS